MMVKATRAQRAAVRPLGFTISSRLMPMSAQEIVEAVLTFTRSWRAPKAMWYVGITADPVDCLKSRHQVENPDTAIYFHAVDEANARAAEKELLTHGFDGDEGGGDNPTCVYVYLQIPPTKRAAVETEGDVGG
jgi:hypothetical protein